MTNVIGNVLIGGGSGFVGTNLVKLLRSQGYGYKIISRMPGPNRMTWHDLTKTGIPPGITAIVNLAGQNVLDLRQGWTPGFKQNIWNSRVNTTQSLIQALTKTSEHITAFVLMTGVGIYEPSQMKQYNENSTTFKHDFLSSLCHEWENAAKMPEDLKTRQIIIRSGVVLGRHGGMIKQIFLPFYCGLGGPIADGKQYLPWIHVDDICRMILYAIENTNVNGILNGVAPEQITNAEFTKVFAAALNRPAFIPIPEKFLKYILHEDRAKMLTQGQRVVPERTANFGFQFLYPKINLACEEFAHL